MILLTVDPKVLEALTRAFPKTNKAQQALDKYVRVLQALIFAAIQRGQNNSQRLLKLYSISTHVLQNQGGRIGEDKIRLHKWLEDNNLSLVRVVTRGSNITGKVSEVALTPLVTIQNLLHLPNQVYQSSPQSITAAIDADKQQSLKLFNQLYPEVSHISREEDLLKIFDPVDIDVKSLAQYLNWLNTHATRLSTHTKNSYKDQATQILRIASVTGGLYLQRKQPSVFGRNYYSGISVQNVNKELRRAMLGDCFEYDISSSATSWKMGHAKEIMASQYPGQNLRKVFSATLYYLEDKKAFIQDLRQSIFEDLSKEREDFQKGLLKQALNAIGFGARLKTQGWKDSSGTWKNPALVEILKNPIERDRFVNNQFVIKFINEQDIIDQFLINQVRANHSHLLDLPEVQTESGRPSKSKIIALLYQHGETQVMDIVRQVAASRGRTPLASVHDAIFFKKKLSGELKFDIEYEMRFLTGNPYWKLAKKEIEGYKAPLPKPDIDTRTKEQITADFLAMTDSLMATL